MASLPRPETDAPSTMMRELKWSPAEKAIARKACDRALQAELAEVIREAKSMAGKIEQPADLWDLEAYLTKRRTEINRKYDYRYSVLPSVFANLIREGRLTAEDLGGLAEDKLRYVRLKANVRPFAGGKSQPA
jgi:hypothetical protein